MPELDASTLPRASVIISSRNRPAMLADCVASILAGDVVPAELIVVDQSEDEHPDLPGMGEVRGCIIRYRWSAERGLSRGRNLGIALARHDVLAFTDDDALVQPGWYGDLIRALVAEGPDAVVTGRVMPVAEQPSGTFALCIKTDEARRVYAGRPGADILYPLNMAMHRGAIEAIGLFDVRLGAGTWFGGAEDNDFGYRLLEAGYRIVHVPAPAVHHRSWRTWRGEYVPLRWAWGRGQGGYYAKYFSLRDPYMLRRMAGDMGGNLRRATTLLRREPWRAAGNVVYVAGLVTGAARWLWQERPMAGSRSVGMRRAPVAPSSRPAPAGGGDAGRYTGARSARAMTRCASSEEMPPRLA